ncbi:MAG: hypothetical protein RIT02_1910 [Planctomycetota bacterium]
MMSLCLSIGTSGWISCQLSVVSCQLSVVSGQWSVVSGQWSVVSGQWSVVSGGCVWEGEAPAEPQGGVPSWCSVVPGGSGRAVGVNRRVMVG